MAGFGWSHRRALAITAAERVIARPDIELFTELGHFRPIWSPTCPGGSTRRLGQVVFAVAIRGPCEGIRRGTSTQLARPGQHQGVDVRRLLPLPGATRSKAGGTLAATSAGYEPDRHRRAAARRPMRLPVAAEVRLRLRELVSEAAMGSDILLDATIVNHSNCVMTGTGASPHDGKG
jgi:hypothetical protein